MSTLNNSHCHKTTMNLLKMNNLSSAICSMYLKWRYLQLPMWWISHVRVFIYRKGSFEHICCVGLNLTSMTHLFQSMYLQLMLKWHIRHLALLNSDIGLLSFMLRKFLRACFGSSPALPIDQKLFIWEGVPEHHKNGEWTAAVQNGTVSVKVKDLQWKLLNYCVNEKLILDQKLTKVNSPDAGFKWVQEFPGHLLGWENWACMFEGQWVPSSYWVLFAFRNTIKNDFVTSCQMVLIHGHCGKAFLQRYTPS